MGGTNLLGEGSRCLFFRPPQSDLGNCCSGAGAPSSVHSALQLAKEAVEYKATNHQSSIAQALDVSKPIFSLKVTPATEIKSKQLMLWNVVADNYVLNSFILQP